MVGGGGSSGNVLVAILEGGDRVVVIWARGVVKKLQRFCYRGWLGGGGLWLVPGVVEEDLSVPVYVHRVSWLPMKYYLRNAWTPWLWGQVRWWGIGAPWGAITRDMCPLRATPRGVNAIKSGTLPCLG